MIMLRFDKEKKNPFHTNKSVGVQQTARSNEFKKTVCFAALGVLLCLGILVSVTDFVSAHKTIGEALFATCLFGAPVAFVVSAIYGLRFIFRHDTVAMNMKGTSVGKALLERGDKLAYLHRSRAELQRALNINREQHGHKGDWPAVSSVHSFRKSHHLNRITCFQEAFDYHDRLLSHIETLDVQIMTIQRKLHVMQTEFLAPFYELKRGENPWIELTKPPGPNSVEAMAAPAM
jgi:hypothetical protein